ncbi:MAG: radical SAM protein [Candidatus Bathyarchaeota archaeon]|nr:MAG: radical SAM protein [Candidatus Bathyarchaeota archaeon]
MARCQICGASSPLISAQLGVCLNCVRSNTDRALQLSSRIHAQTRKAFNLPVKPPQTPHGLQCGQCANNCRIGEGQQGYCGLVENHNGEMLRHGGTAQKGVLHWYYDPLPTNCVSWWFCPGCTGLGYPQYANKATAETSYSNLAVFYGSCSVNCIFCQNWQHRDLASKHEPTVSATELASKVHDEVSCICFFGGDPSTQMPHALKTSQIVSAGAVDKQRIMRICWETNGQMIEDYARQAAELSLKSGGNMKFDLKTWDDNLSKTLCDASNEPAFENFQKIGQKFYSQRSELPLLTASTLLIPGYVDAHEVANIAKFIADIDPRIPYSILAFYPAYALSDLPRTSRKYAHACYEAATKYLENVRIGNTNLLS